MILQYMVGNKEVYQDSDAISVAKIKLDDNGKTLNDVLILIEEEIGVVSVIDCDGKLQSDDSIKGLKCVKLATLSDGAQKSNNKVLAFGGDAPVYILNNEGKTIRKF